jgi:hypothetical protein
VVGSGNFTDAFPERTDADDQESRRRLDAALAWLHESFMSAKSQSATAVVVAFQADPGFDSSTADVTPFKRLLDAVEDEAVGFRKPVLLIHGDLHRFTIDNPLKARATQHPVRTSRGWKYLDRRKWAGCVLSSLRVSPPPSRSSSGSFHTGSTGKAASNGQQPRNARMENSDDQGPAQAVRHQVVMARNKSERLQADDRDERNARVDESGAGTTTSGEGGCLGARRQGAHFTALSAARVHLLRMLFLRNSK